MIAHCHEFDKRVGVRWAHAELRVLESIMQFNPPIAHYVASADSVVRSEHCEEVCVYV